jgi:UDP-glucose 4-epimerase
VPTSPYDAAFGGQPVTILGLGFLGSYLATRLHDLGASVTVLTHRRISAVVDRLGPGLHVIEGDIRQSDDVQRAVEGATAVFNVCGVSGPAASNADPARDLSVNCGGVLTVLEAVRQRAPQARVLFAGSRLQFGAPARLPVREDDPQLPTSFYGIHKMTAEAYHRIFWRLHGLPTTVLRLANPYGVPPAGPTAGYNILNNFVQLALEDADLEVFAPGEQTRDYIHVDDVVDVFLRAASDQRAVGEAFNIGSGVETRLVDAANTVVRIVGRGRVKLTPWPAKYRATETGDFVFDIAKARRLLDWKPQVSFERGIVMTVDAARREVAR